uniref:Uncharacterized protein n=1 Tax=Heliothis virescens TaxID=7102 RepID=A0A2A4IXJ0_HELVI
MSAWVVSVYVLCRRRESELGARLQPRRRWRRAVALPISLNLSDRDSHVCLSTARYAHTHTPISLNLSDRDSHVCLSTARYAHTHTPISLNLSDRDSHVCLSTARCCEPVGSDTVGADGSGAGGSGAGGSGAGGSCERERGSPDEPRLYTPCAGRCESRQAKLASRVKLRRTDNSDSSEPRNTDWWSAERVSVELCAHADLRDALHAAQNEGCTWAARCARLRAERRVLQCALARAADTAHRCVYITHKYT